MLTALALVVALSTGQVAGVCGSGRNCRVATLTTTRGSASIEMQSSNLAFQFWGNSCNGRPNGSNMTFAGCNFAFQSSGGSSQFLLGGGLYLAPFALPTSFQTASSLVGAGTLNAETINGRIYASDGRTWNELGGGRHPVRNARTYLVDISNTGALAFIAGQPRINGTNITFTETGSCAQSTISSTGDFGSFSRESRACTTTAVASNVSGGWTNNTANGWATSNRIQVCMRASLDLTTTVRAVFGQMPAANFAAPTDLPTAAGMWFRFSSVVGDTNWMLCTSDGASAATCTSSGVSAASGALLCLDQREGSTGVTGWVNGGNAVVPVRVTTNLPTTSTVTAIGFAVQTQAASTRTANVGPISIEVP